MRVAAHIGVKDEIDLIPRCITHLRKMGVDSFIVCDMASSDGTREYLNEQEGGDFRVIDSSNTEPDESWRQRNAAAIRECNADWVLMIDADEFPLAKSGDLHAALSRIETDVLKIPRYNVVLSPEGPLLPFPCPPTSYDAVELIVKAPKQFKQELAKDPSLPWIRHVPLPKCAVRPSIVSSLRDGMHDIVSVKGTNPRRSTASGILLAHVALSTFSRFKHKVQNIRSVFTHHDGVLSPEFGWHWRRWIELDHSGELHEEFQRSTFSQPFIEQLRAQGSIRTATQMLAEVPS